MTLAGVPDARKRPLKTQMGLSASPCMCFRKCFETNSNKNASSPNMALTLTVLYVYRAFNFLGHMRKNQQFFYVWKFLFIRQSSFLTVIDFESDFKPDWIGHILSDFQKKKIKYFL